MTAIPFILSTIIALQTPAEEFKTVDGTIAAVYDVLSGPVEKERDWPRFLSIFAPGAMLRTFAPTKEGPQRLIEIKPEEYVDMGKRMFKQAPFYEKEIARKSEVYGSISNVWSTYEIRRDPAEKPILRGINNISLGFDGTRWWVVGIIWQQESPKNPIPQIYLPG